MKNLYPKSKGKIYPSPSSSSSSSSSSSASSAATSNVLNLLPAAILALVSVLGYEDREVLAYLTLRSINTPSSMLQEERKCKRNPNASHKPLLDCPCFDCYTCFWTRWDSSPNRELIHQAIEAFEEHLTNGEAPKKTGRKKDRATQKRAARPKNGVSGRNNAAEKTPDCGSSAVAGAAEPDKEESGPEPSEAVPEVSVLEKKEVEAVVQQPAGNNRGLVRKVWPDVMGMFNLRLWGLWNPSV